MKRLSETWEYEPTPRYVLYSGAGSEIGECILDQGSFAGLNITEYWRAIAGGSLVKRCVTLAQAKDAVAEALNTRGLSVVHSSSIQTLKSQ